MHTTRRTLIVALMMGLLLVADTAAAEPFWLYPPEESGPPGSWMPDWGWATPFPYPRNIYWDFELPPDGGPSPEGPPGAHYEGWDDPALKGSDYVELTGDMQWHESVQPPLFGLMQGVGVIGIDNRSGATTLTGSAIFHIDNSDRPWVKHVYVEEQSGAPYGEDPEGIMDPDIRGEMSMELILPPGYDIIYTDHHEEVLIEPWWTVGYTCLTVVPNPPWEEIVLTVTVDPGEEFYFDFLHVATECIPEPAGLGAIGLALLALRRRRR